MTRNFRQFRWCNLGRILIKWNCISSNLLIIVLCLNVCRGKYYKLRCMFKKNFTLLMLARAYSTKLAFSVRFERRKVDKKQTYMKTEACKLYSRDFWIFLPNIVKIDHYNSELYRFKVGAFFETQCTCGWHKNKVGWFVSAINTKKPRYRWQRVRCLYKYRSVTVQTAQLLTARSTHVRSALFLWHVVCPSVCLSAREFGQVL